MTDHAAVPDRLRPVTSLRNLIPAAVRTIVPFLYPLIGPWVLRHLGIDAPQLNATLTVVVGGVLYLVVGLVEKFAPRAGWLLLWPAQPAYAPRGVDGVPDISDIERDAEGSA